MQDDLVGYANVIAGPIADEGPAASIWNAVEEATKPFAI
jgi:hypothetical protein